VTDRQTDEQTDRNTISISAWCVARKKLSDESLSYQSIKADECRNESKAEAENRQLLLQRHEQLQLPAEAPAARLGPGYTGCARK